MLAAFNEDGSADLSFTFTEPRQRTAAAGPYFRVIVTQDGKLHQSDAGSGTLKVRVQQNTQYELMLLGGWQNGDLYLRYVCSEKFSVKDGQTVIPLIVYKLYHGNGT
jgi:hypothetical protein